MTTLTDSVSLTVFFIYVILLGAWMAPGFFCPDYAPGSVLANVIPRGYSRIEVFFAKYITIIIMHVFAFAVSFSAGVAVGAAFVEGDLLPMFTSEQLNVISKMFLTCFSTLNLQILLSVLLKKKIASFVCLLVSNPALAFVLYILPVLNEKLEGISTFVQGWYPPFAYMKVIIAKTVTAAGLGSLVKIDFQNIVLSSIIMLVLTIGGTILILRKKEIYK